MPDARWPMADGRWPMPDGSRLVAIGRNSTLLSRVITTEGAWQRRTEPGLSQLWLQWRRVFAGARAACRRASAGHARVVYRPPPQIQSQAEGNAARTGPSSVPALRRYWTESKPSTGAF